MLTLTSKNNIALVRSLVEGSGEYITVHATAPIVNLNGATRESLLEQQFAVSRAIDALRTAIAAAAPHGRDFQVGDPDGKLLADARMEYLSELDILNTMDARHDLIKAQLFSQD